MTLTQLPVRLLAAGALVAGGLAALAPPSVAAPPQQLRPVVLDEGHIDLLELTWDADAGALDLRTKDDTQLYGLGTAYRDPEDVTILVDADLARAEVPDLPEYSFLGAPGDPFYYLPVVQADDLPWPGWSSERFTASLPAGVSVADQQGSITYDVAVEGPGDVFTFDSGVIGPPTGRWVDTTDAAPDVIETRPGVHNHSDWAFTAPGDYELVITPSARTTSGEVLTGPARSYHVRVAPRPADLTRRVDATSVGATVGGAPDSVAADTPVTLSADIGQGTAVAGHQWYAQGAEGRLEPIPGATAASLATTVSPFDFVVVAYLDADGRVITTASHTFLAPPSVPAAPPSVTATLAGARDVTVTWATPYDGRSPITSYAVTLTSAAGEVLGPLAPSDLGDLRVRFPDVPDGTWRASVSATNERGPGAATASAPVVVGTPTTPTPTTPTTPTPTTPTSTAPTVPAARATTVTADPVTQVWGKPAILDVRVSEGAAGPVTAVVAGRVLSGTAGAGTARLTLPAGALPPGSHTVTVAYAGSGDTWAPSSGTAAVDVQRATSRTVITRSPARLVPGRVARFTVRVRAGGVDPEARVSVRVAGVTRRVEVGRRGTATVTVRVPVDADPGRTTVTAVYAGDAFTTRSSDTARVRLTR